MSPALCLWLCGKITNDDLRQLEAGPYKVVIDRCMLSLTWSSLPEPLHLTVRAFGEISPPTRRPTTPAQRRLSLPEQPHREQGYVRLSVVKSRIPWLRRIPGLLIGVTLAEVVGGTLAHSTGRCGGTALFIVRFCG